MIPGSPTTVPPGDNEQMLSVFDIGTTPGGVVLSLRARAGYAQYWVPIVEGKPFPAIYVPDDATVQTIVFANTTKINSVIMWANGQWPSIQGDIQAGVLYWGTGNGKRILYNITPNLEYLPDSADITITSTTGATRGQNVLPDTELRRNWARLTYVVTDDGGGDYTTTFYGMNGLAVAAGTDALGPVTCTAVNDSGLTVVADIAFSSFPATGTVWIRWPEKYGLFWTGAALIPDGLVYDDGAANTFIGLSSQLEPDTYECWIRQYSDNDQATTESAHTTVTIPGPPDVMTNLAYVSGNYTNTLISWTAPVGGVTPDGYKVYDSGNNAENFLDVLTPAHTTASTSQTLVSAVPTRPFTRTILVRPYDGAYENKNVAYLTIEYNAAGAVVPARPNEPVIVDPPGATESTLNVNASYDPNGAAAVATVLRLYAWAYGGTPDYSTIRNVVSVGTSASIYELSADLAALVSSPGGLISFAVRAATAGGQEDANMVVGGPVEITVASIAAAPSVVITVGP